LGRVTKANGGKSLLMADQHWENADFLRLRSVFRDGDRFRTWYMMNDGLCGYAEPQAGPAMGHATATITQAIA